MIKDAQQLQSLCFELIEMSYELFLVIYTFPTVINIWSQISTLLSVVIFHNSIKRVIHFSTFHNQNHHHNMRLDFQVSFVWPERQCGCQDNVQVILSQYCKSFHKLFPPLLFPCIQKWIPPRFDTSSFWNL